MKERAVGDDTKPGQVVEKMGDAVWEEAGDRDGENQTDDAEGPSAAGGWDLGDAFEYQRVADHGDAQRDRRAKQQSAYVVSCHPVSPVLK